MDKRLLIPHYAKVEAQRGLDLRNSLPPNVRFGLNKKQADALGIQSGVERAHQIINNTYLNFDDVRSVARFYQRFRNCHTPSCEGAIQLWGGRRFGSLAIFHVNKIRRMMG